ncbi:MAG: ATP-dependent metallopeptidase FtsH/Yme1/Tma family protein [Candidatus Competibacteraceae bacterium]
MRNSSKRRQTSYSQFIAEVRNGSVNKVFIQDRTIIGVRTTASGVPDL